MTSVVALALVAGWLWWRRCRQRRAGQLRSERGSAAYFLRWSERIAVTYGAPAAMAMVLIGGDARVIPAAFAPLATAAGYPSVFPVDLLLLGIAAGSVIGAAIAWWRGPARPWIGAPIREAVTPAAVLAALLLAGTAGVVEELFFRWLLPLLVAGTGAGALAGFAASSVLFGWLHRYQGRAGMVATGIAGVLFAWLYLASGSLALAMLTHALVDVNALLVRPWAARLRTSAASPSGRWW